MLRKWRSNRLPHFQQICWIFRAFPFCRASTLTVITAYPKVGITRDSFLVMLEILMTWFAVGICGRRTSHFGSLMRNIWRGTAALSSFGIQKCRIAFRDDATNLIGVLLSGCEKNPWIERSSEKAWP